MTRLDQNTMAEATRRTREDSLEEAMTVLRGSRPDAAAATGASGGAGDRPDRRARSSTWCRPPPARMASGPRHARALLRPAPRRTVWAPRSAGCGARPSGNGPCPIPWGARGAGKPSVAVPPGARFESRVHSGAFGSRPYRLYVPGGHAGCPLPLVLMLHGCTQSPEDFAAGTRMNEVAGEVGLVVAYPEQTRAANASHCWN